MTYQKVGSWSKGMRLSILGIKIGYVRTPPTHVIRRGSHSTALELFEEIRMRKNIGRYL